MPFSASRCRLSVPTYTVLPTTAGDDSIGPLPVDDHTTAPVTRSRAEIVPATVAEYTKGRCQSALNTIAGDASSCLNAVANDFHFVDSCAAADAPMLVSAATPVRCASEWNIVQSPKPVDTVDAFVLAVAASDELAQTLAVTTAAATTARIPRYPHTRDNGTRAPRRRVEP